MRLYKGSRYNIQILLTKHYDLPIDNVKIVFYTTDPEKNVTVDEGITVNGNIANVVIPADLFNHLDEGVLIYIVYATADGVSFMGERQSNYYLKDRVIGEVPDDEDDVECLHQEKNIVVGNDQAGSTIVITPDEGYKGLDKVTIEVEPCESKPQADPKAFALFNTRFGTHLEVNSSSVCKNLNSVLYSVNKNTYNKIFDHTYAQSHLMNNWSDYSEYEKCLYLVLTKPATDISNMYTGTKVVPALTLEMDASNVKTCENSFNGFMLLGYAKLDNLGFSFETEQTLNLTPTDLNNEYIKDLADSLFNFNEGANMNGVVTSYVYGVNPEYQQYFTDKGWICN